MKAQKTGRRAGFFVFDKEARPDGRFFYDFKGLESE